MRVTKKASINVELTPSNAAESALNADELTRLVEEHSDYLYRYGKRYCSNETLLQDLVQDTFFAAIKSWSTFQGQSSPRTWLTSILRHKIIDNLRNTGRFVERSFEDVRTADSHAQEMFGQYDTYPDHWLLDRGPGNWDSSPEALLSQKDFLKQYQSCLAKLPERLKQIFLLRESEELSAQKISEQLSLSVANVRVILHRARLLLRDCLEQNWFNNFSKAQ